VFINTRINDYDHPLLKYKQFYKNNLYLGIEISTTEEMTIFTTTAEDIKIVTTGAEDIKIVTTGAEHIKMTTTTEEIETTGNINI
jgi:hypothetical protein